MIDDVLTGSHRFVSSMGAYGSDSMKTLEFWTDISEAACYLARSKKDARGRMKTKAKRSLTAEGAKSASASGSATWRNLYWVNGKRSEMKESSEYPDEFASWVAKFISDDWKHRQPKKARTHPELAGMKR